MGLFLTRQLQQANLGIWEVTESVEQLRQQINLSGAEEAYYGSLRSVMRKKQWLSYRLILPHIMDKDKLSGIHYDEYGKPHLSNGAGHISVAHAGKFAALIASRKGPVGIDIEAVTQRIHQLASRFLSAKELSYDYSSAKTESLCLIWCAKEALYKLYGKKNLSFRNQLLVDPFIFLGAGQLTGHILKEGAEGSFPLYYESIEQHLLVYAFADDSGNQT